MAAVLAAHWHGAEQGRGVGARRRLHPINERSAGADDDVALVDDVAVRHELVAGAEHSSGAAAGVRWDAV